MLENHQAQLAPKTVARWWYGRLRSGSAAERIRFEFVENIDLFDQINKYLEREPTSRVEFMPAGSCLWKVQHSSPPEWKLKCRHVLESPGDVLDCVFRGVVTKIRPP